MNAKRQRGFTLLELIVAAGILALIAVFSWRGLDALIREREAIVASQAAIDAYQRSFARLERDALLAGDVELDEGGTMRLLAGDAAPDGVQSPSVEYRLVGNALTRSVEGVDAAPLVILDGVAALTMEAWLPVPSGGSWVKSKVQATPLPRPAGLQTSPAAGPDAGGAAGNANANAANGTPADPNANRPNSASNAPGAARVPRGGNVATVSAASGIRLSFARVDGTRVTRSFMVGGN